MSNKFRDPMLRKCYDAGVTMFQEKHRNLFTDGEPSRLNGIAMAFWRGFNAEIPGSGWDRTSKKWPSYAYWCAGRDMRKTCDM